ncbi:MAG: YHS domain-containing protein [Verrucomicrobiales bacterium]|nr:YHS domain-containing protein [Verrucomicrobiales bacterium]
MRPLTLFLSILVLAGCTSLPPMPPEDAPIAQCPVCRHDRDLACLNVVKEKSTPRLTYQGRSYFFCSEGCREKCAHTPAKFIQP